MHDATIPEATKVMLALDLWFEDRPRGVDLGEVIDAMLDFYRCGKPEGVSDGDTRRLFDYAHDYDLIFAAFLGAYGIDLLDPDVRLHWWRFRAMLAALPEDCQFMRVVGYRAAKITPDTPKEQRQFLQKMKRLHALPEDEASAPVRLVSEADYADALAAVIEAKRATMEAVKESDDASL